MSKVEAGQEFRNPYPFVRGTFTSYDEGGEYEVKTWNPGVVFEACGYYGDESQAVAQGEGFQILTVIDVYKPGKYPERVFYTMTWIDPDGREFGKRKLRIAITEKFRRLSQGYKFAYIIEREEVAA